MITRFLQRGRIHPIVYVWHLVLLVAPILLVFRAFCAWLNRSAWPSFCISLPMRDSRLRLAHHALSALP